MSQLLSDADLLARLIAFDSTSVHSNLPIADFICEYLDSPGVRIHRNPSADGEKVNLVVRMGPEAAAQRDGLTLSAHMDVVPAGDGWDSDPFALTDGGDRWLGRGTADMKGFLALAVNGAARIDPSAFEKPLALVLTFDEELGGLGAGHLAATWPQDDPLPRATVIGEPTSFAAVRLHKGHLKMRVTLSGVNAHSGYPHLGVNAIEPAGAIITALAALREVLSGERPRHHEHFPDTPFVALNVARVHGGSAINVVPDRCVIELGFRMLPEMDAAAMIARVEEAVQKAAEGAGAGDRCEVEVINELPPMLLADSAPIYRAVCEMTGQSETVSASYGTDGAWLQHLGLDCVIFGPGTIEVAHKPNEYMLKADLMEGERYVTRLIERFCLG
jgi:acetylornithine deacetylase